VANYAAALKEYIQCVRIMAGYTHPRDAAERTREAHMKVQQCRGLLFQHCREHALRANIDETILPVIISEQGENRGQCEEQRNSFGFSHGFACR